MLDCCSENGDVVLLVLSRFGAQRCRYLRFEASFPLQIAKSVVALI